MVNVEAVARLLSAAARQPWFSALTASLGAIVGLFGSIFSTEIKSAFPFAVGANFIWQAAVFYLFLALFAYCFRLQMQGQSASLSESSDKLERLIRTLPPDGFLRKYEQLVVRAGGEVVRAGDPAVKDDGVREAAQVVLSALVLLAKMFDGNPKSGRYAINLMLFESAPVAADQLPGWSKGISMWERGRSLDNLAGLLVLDKGLALVLSGDDSEELALDEHVRPLKLPVLRAEFFTDKQGRLNVLPGAPYAFCFPNETELCTETKSFVESWRLMSGLRPEIADEMAEYFNSSDGKLVRSFVALPVLEPPDSVGAQPNVVGVVNIHSDQTGILQEGGKDLFFPLATTFTLMLGALVRKLNRLKGGESHQSLDDDG